MTARIFNAAGHYQREVIFPGVATFSQSLDNILGGYGARLGTITEILGAPGTGKTQLCLQMCASVQIPEQLGGLNAEALYIDTNSNFDLPRFKEILKASLLKCQGVMKGPLKITEDEALKRVHHIKAIGLERYCSLLYTLPNYIKSHPKIKLIVIDSLSQPFKTNFTNLEPRQRNGVLYRHMADLQKIAVDNQIAVMLANDMSTRFGLNSNSLVGALGDSWAHRCNIRLILSMLGNEPPHLRLAMLMKTNLFQTEIARFQITSEGIRDCAPLDTYRLQRTLMNYNYNNSYH